MPTSQTSSFRTCAAAGARSWVEVTVSQSVSLRGWQTDLCGCAASAAASLQARGGLPSSS